MSHIIKKTAVAVILLLTSVMLTAPAQAQPVGMSGGFSIIAVAAAGAGGDKQATCTKDMPKASNNDGIMTQVIDYIKEVIDSATADLYNGVVQNQSFRSAVDAAFALFVTLFGVMFIFGIVPLTLGQASVRLFKMAIILAMINEGFAFFQEYAIRFFNDGTDELIDAVLSIATGDHTPAGVNAHGSPQPFKKIEGIVGNALSPQMMIATIGSFTQGPAGLGMGAMLGMGMMAFVQTIVKSLKVYCLSLIAKALLFGLAPIFVCFIMFERTKHMFQGWLNQLVNYSLQPLFMFTFLSFYIILLDSAAKNILNANICWTEFEHMRGTNNTAAFWRFVDSKGNNIGDDQTWNGAVSCVKNGGSDCKDFPISVIDLLTFLILAHLAFKFSDVVVMIATEISSSTLMLDKLQGGMGKYFQEAGGGNKAPPKS